MAIVNYSSPSEMSYYLYGAPSGRLDNVIARETARFMSGVGEHGQQFFQATQRAVDLWHGSHAVSQGRRALAKINNVLFQEDIVIYLNSVEKIQTAQPAMRRVVKAHPQIAKLHRRGRISGYGEEYDASQVAETQLYINDGVLKVDEEGNTSMVQVVKVEDHNTHLAYTLDEQEDIADTYAIIENAILKNIDVTSEFGSDIG